MFKIAAAAIFSLGLATSVQATTIIGSMAVSEVGISSTTSSIGLGTTFTNTLFSVAGGATGDLSGTVGSFLTLSSLTATVGQSFSFTSAFGNFSGTVTSAFATGTTTNRTVGAYILGTFLPSGTLSSFDAGPASVTFSFVQTGLGASVAGGFSFASPPSPSPAVPEPATWAMILLGFGALGVSLRARKAAVTFA